MKIKNEKHFAILGHNYIAADAMGGPMPYRKGMLVDLRGIYEHNGFYVVEGHGIGHIIPRNLFTKFVKVWDEVETTVENGAKVTKTTHRKADETKEILAWWAKRDAKKNAETNREERARIRNRIAVLRRDIKFVKTGAAEKELAELLNKI